jgi:hypothetical protein
MKPDSLVAIASATLAATEEAEAHIEELHEGKHMKTRERQCKLM